MRLRKRKKHSIPFTKSSNYQRFFKVANEVLEKENFDTLKSVMNYQLSRVAEGGRVASNLSVIFYDQDRDNFIRNLTTVVFRYKLFRKPRIIKGNALFKFIGDETRELLANATK